MITAAISRMPTARRVREYVRRRFEIECRAEAEPFRDLADDPPTSLATPGRRQKARSAVRRSELVRCQISRPRLRRRHMRAGVDDRWNERSRDDDSSRAFSMRRGRHRRPADTAGLVPITHIALISPRPTASNNWTAFEALMGGDASAFRTGAHGRCPPA